MVSKFVFFLFLLSNPLNASVITEFSPEGIVKNIKQVTVHFSEDMTPLGDPRDTIHPIIPKCLDKLELEIKLPAAQSRWADSRHWVLDFEAPLASGVRCLFVIKEGLKDLKGQSVTGKEGMNFRRGDLPSLAGILNIRRSNQVNILFYNSMVQSMKKVLPKMFILKLKD
jgi:hypothetical protein